MPLLYAMNVVAAPPTRESIETLLVETKVARPFDSMLDNHASDAAADRRRVGNTRTVEQQRAMSEMQARIRPRSGCRRC